MNANRILNIYNNKLRESFLSDLTVDSSQRYKEKYVNSIVRYFETKFKYVEATFLNQESLKSVALINIYYSNYKNLLESERKELRSVCVNSFVSQLPKIKKSIKEYSFIPSSNKLLYGITDFLTEIVIFSPSKPKSKILQEFKISNRHLFIIGISDNIDGSGIRLYVMFNGIVSSFSEFIEHDIWYRLKTRRIVADITEADFQEFNLEIKHLIDAIVKAVRFIET